MGYLAAANNLMTWKLDENNFNSQFRLITRVGFIYEKSSYQLERSVSSVDIVSNHPEKRKGMRILWQFFFVAKEGKICEKFLILQSCDV